MIVPTLDLPSRSTKPRTSGLTIAIDTGLPVRAFVDAVESAADVIDLVKFGWGTALVTPHLADKIAVLHEHEIGYFFGGTLGEKFIAQHRFDEYLSFCHRHLCRYVEVSNGTIPLDNRRKAHYIARAASRFSVFSEVGYKDQERSQELDAEQWVASITQDLAAGATFVITEARESGRSGICHADGNLRFELVEHILGSGIPHDRLVFEAPTKDLQAFFVTRLGPDVNLANIAVADVLATETLRLGLRADTLLHFELERHHRQELANRA